MECIDTGDASACPWRLDKADLPTDMRVVELFERVYLRNNKINEMDVIYPKSVFPLTPALPTCI